MYLKIGAVVLLFYRFILSTCSAESHVNTNFMDMNLEELMNLEITSVGKKKQKLTEAASAVFVITQEDLRRSGVTSIAEALRMVPGLQVARIDANKWAVSSRGFFGLSGRFENKLLVMIDGRSVYTPLFSGVFWELQDTLLADIERIEVIRGSGATLWGTNAVNGVINIITKNARDTQGNLLSGGVGTEEKSIAKIRHGGTIADNTFYRLYAKYIDRDAATLPSGQDAADDWNTLLAGFRLDREGAGRDAFTLQGDIFAVGTGETVTTPLPAPPFAETTDERYTNRGGNLLGRWKRSLSNTAELAFQAYYDRTEYNTQYMGSVVDTFDFDFQNRFKWQEDQEIIWGVGYRHILDHIDNTYAGYMVPDSDHYDIFNFFLQDDIILISERLNLILGSKFEHNDFTGLEIQPNARLLWQIAERQSAWAAVSRAVRTPSRGETNSTLRMALPDYLSGPQQTSVQLQIIGNPQLASETLIAYELGYRWQPRDFLTFDLAVFYNDYDKVRLGKVLDPGMEYSSTSDGPLMVIPYKVQNILYGESHGIELTSDWRVTDWWRLQSAYTFLQMNVRSDDGTLALINIEDLNDRSPRHQWSLRSSMDVARNLELDLWGRYVDAIKTINGTFDTIDVDGYFTLDARLGWNITRDLKFSLVGQNLLNNHHIEFVSEIFQTSPAEVERSVYALFTLRF